MPYIGSLKVEQLRSIAWYYANAAVNTDKSDRHLIDFFRLKRADLQNHITNTIGITEISDADLEERRKEWMRCKDTAKAVLDDLINSPLILSTATTATSTTTTTTATTMIISNSEH